MSDVQAGLKKMIQTHFPHFIGATLRPLGEGERSAALLVNDEWVFRFPKNRLAAEELNKEIRLLPALIPQLSVSIPDFVYFGEQENGFPFVGYKRLPGELMGEEAVPGLSASAQQEMAADIARFMTEISAFPLDQALELGVPLRKLENEFRELGNRVEGKLFPLLDEPLRQYITSRFKAYWSEASFTRYAPSLIHGDLSPDHFLIDTTSGRLSGVIDFGDTVLCDPDYEYVYLLEDGGEPFAREVMRRRGVANPDALLRKIALFVTFDQVAYTMDGVENGDHARVREGIALIREEMERTLGHGRQ